MSLNLFTLYSHLADRFLGANLKPQLRIPRTSALRLAHSLATTLKDDHATLDYHASNSSGYASNGHSHDSNHDDPNDSGNDG